MTATIAGARLQRLQRLLDPRTIAVIGGAEACQVIQQCRKLQFAGEIWPVNPRRDTMEGLPCRSNIAELPAPPDAAFIAIPAAPSIEAIDMLSRVGAGGAVCYAAGFKEIGGDGNERHQRLIEAAAAMPIIGPNCYGFINLTSGAALWPDYHGARRVQRGVAIFSQSGNVSLNLSMQRRRLPLAWLVSLGNQAVVGVEDGIAAALASDRITAIGIHIEGLGDLPRFARLAQQAKCQGVPIVALKSGRSALGARIAVSHTATLAGESALYDSLFERLGIGRVATPEEFIETLKLLSIGGALPGARIASMSCSGGEAALVADLAGGRDLEFPALTPSHRRAVQATLNDYVHVSNPLDYHTFIWGDRARMCDTFGAMMLAKFDLTLLILDLPADDRTALARWLQAVRAFIEACRATGARGALVTMLSENLPDEASRLLAENGIAPLQGLDQALAAVEAAAAIGCAWARAVEAPTLTPTTAATAAAAAAGEPRILDEFRAKRLLAQAGLSVAPSVVVDSPESAVAAAGQLGYPVALKALSEHIAHKTEVGGVVLDLREDEHIRKQAARMLAGAEQLLVEKMVEGVVAELLLGVGHDRQFGHYFIIGFGGTLVELIGDRRMLLPPLDEAQLRRALDRLKTAPLLRGYRGRPAADIDSVVRCALALGRLVESGAAGIIEVEINPLMVKSENKGAIVADALLTVGGGHGR